MHNNQLSLSKKSIEEGIVILINKEKNWTSFDVVKKIKNLIRAKFDLKKIKVGHAGTLDPLATGLLIICTGKYTKKISKIQDLQKTYTREITIGAKTTPSALVGIIMLTEAILGPLWAWLFINETPPLVVLVGGSIVLFAVVLQFFNRKIV